LEGLRLRRIRLWRKSPPLRAIAALAAAAQGNTTSPAAGRHHISIWGRGKGGALVRHIGQTILPRKLARRRFHEARAAIYVRLGTAAEALNQGLRLGAEARYEMRKGAGTVAGYFTGAFVY
jgi:hypothetical protein